MLFRSPHSRRPSPPEVVKVYGWGVEPGFGYLVCELIHGTTLDRYARGLPFERRLALTAELLRAVSVLYAGGVVHRDLKPTNVPVRSEERRVGHECRPRQSTVS